MRILVALGGNALLRRGEPAGAATQRNVGVAARQLAGLAAEHELILTHGNGQQVGLALRNAMPGREVVTVLTEVVVDRGDPASAAASKPIGPIWAPSPEPFAIPELRSLRLLIESGVLVVCAGGGGIPVAIAADGTLAGVEAVVDMDLTAALLARRLGADLLLLLTDVDSIHLAWGEADERPLRAVDPQGLRELRLAAGSMAPKAEAACRFVEATGRRAAIGGLTQAAQIVAGEAGTQVRPLVVA